MVVLEDGRLTTCLMKEGELEVWDFILDHAYLPNLREPRAVLEMQTPRPTNIPDRENGGWRRTVLASTCILYGNYCSLRTMLELTAIPYEDCPPKRWQKAFNLKRVKGEKDGSWKNRLKEEAQRLYPRQWKNITLDNADAVLMAAYCERINQ